jgi:hypothetical protein
VATGSPLQEATGQLQQHIAKARELRDRAIAKVREYSVKLEEHRTSGVRLTNALAELSRILTSTNQVIEGSAFRNWESPPDTMVAVLNDWMQTIGQNLENDEKLFRSLDHT